MNNYTKYYSTLLMTGLLLIPLNGSAHGDVHQRIDVLTKQLSQKVDIDLLLERGLLLQDDGNHLAAWADYKRALKLEPENPDVLYHSAKSALEMQQIEKALSLAEHFQVLVEALSSSAAHARSYELLYEIHSANQDNRKALLFLEKSIRLKKHPQPSLLLSLADLQLQQIGYDTALATLEKALLKSGQNVTLQQKMVEMAIAQKDYARALHYLDIQLEKSASLYKVMLLGKKWKTLLLAGDKKQANKVNEKARKAFQELPDNKRKIQVAILLWNQLNVSTP